MEGRLQGPINPCFLEEEHLDVELEYNNRSITKLGFGSSDGSFEEMRIPFLEMLQQQSGGDSPAAFSPFCELSFHALLSLQQQQQQQQFKNPPSPWEESDHQWQYSPEIIRSKYQQPDSSCLLTHEAVEEEVHHQILKSETCMDHHNNNNNNTRSGSGSGLGSATYVVELGLGADGNQFDLSKVVELELEQQGRLAVAVEEAAAQKKRKRVKKKRRTRPSARNKEEVETQRMTHIAVERNRRRQMNDHLTALRSLMPSSYIHRGDQASIIGGAIDYVKELEQLHQSLEAQKRMKKSERHDQSDGSETGSTSTSSSTATGVLGTSSSPQSCQLGKMKPEIGQVGNCSTEEGLNVRRCYEITAAKKSGAVEVHVTVIQNHVNLKVECPRRAGLLLNAIIALEDLGLTVLHLNIMALENSARYTFNLKIEEGCEIGSADGVAVVVHQIFSFINRAT